MSKDGTALSVTPKGFQELMVATKAFAPAQARLLRRNIRTAAQSVLGYVRAEVMGGSYVADTGLRSGIASGLKVQISTSVSQPGVRIVGTASAMPPGKAPLVKAWEAKTFRHPVFGNADVFVSQSGHPYFYRTVYAHRDKVTTAVEAAMTEAAATLAGGTA